jgi:nicotinate-nucleotide pyrophosphorylase
VITYGNANYRKKFDAFRIIDQSGCEPLKEMISCALDLRSTCLKLMDEAKALPDQEARLKATVDVVAALDRSQQAWERVAAYVYAKQRHVEVSGSVTLEQLLAGSWDDKPRDMIAGPQS